MSDTFTHKFGGWIEAPARRWKNPDGSEGGIVAVSAAIHPTAFIAPSAEVWAYARIGEGASVGYYARIGEGASVGEGASIGKGASIGEGASVGKGASVGEGASIGKGASIGEGASVGKGASVGEGVEYAADDWLFVLGPQGRRSAWLTAVWSPVRGLRFWTGCKRGLTVEEALAAVDAEHGSTARGDDYRYAINTILSHPGLARAKAMAVKTEAGNG